MKIEVRVTAEEKAAIREMAELSGLQMSTYIRRVAMDPVIVSKVDNDCVAELARISADLGRLGGLLKLWLTNDPKVAGVGAAKIRTVLNMVRENNEDLKKQIPKILKASQ